MDKAYYLCVTFSALLFSLQFLFNQRFQQEYGTGSEAAHVFTFYRSMVMMIIMFGVNGFSFEITEVSILLATVSALAGIVMQYYSLKTFEIVNLSVYSVFAMLGGMLLPFLTGIIFYHEDLNAFKIICCALIILAVLINIRDEQQGKKTFIYYMVVFVLNGMAGVISKIHQSTEAPHVDSASFVFLSSAISIVISGVSLLWKCKRIPIPAGKSIFYTVGFGAFNGIGNWILLFSLCHLPASVQYPLVTGGTMVFSTLISMVRKEKLQKTDCFAAVIAFVAAVMMAF